MTTGARGHPVLRIAQPRAAHGGRWAAGKANVDSCRDNTTLTMHPPEGVAPWLVSDQAPDLSMVKLARELCSLALLLE